MFPVSDADDSKSDFGEYSECGKGGAAVRPRRGDALLFWSLKPDASLDDKSLHGEGFGGGIWAGAWEDENTSKGMRLPSSHTTKNILLRLG